MEQLSPQAEQHAQAGTHDLSTPPKRPYQAPEVMVMDEKDVLKVFQITSAGVSWWG